MLFEIKGVCMHCAEAVSPLVHNGKVIGKCPSCSNDPFEVNDIDGIVYVVKNDHQTGVKIGTTTKSVEDRAKALSSTGVPGSFYPIAIFPSQSAKKHEKMAHEKLIKHKIEKEHFDLEPVDAVVKVYRALNKRIEPIFYNDEHQKAFRLKLEKDRIDMELKLSGNKLK